MNKNILVLKCFIDKIMYNAIRISFLALMAANSFKSKN